MCGGSPLNRDVATQLFDLLPNNFVEGYGSTETELVSLLPRRAPREKRGSVGKPIRDVDVRILAEHDDVELEPNQCGEIAVRSRSLFEAYTRDGDAENPLWYGSTSGSPFYKTGDLGFLDDDGYLWLSGRKKDMIITAGFNIFPSDLEAVLLQHPAVEEAAVIGVPKEPLGETPVAFVVVRTQVTASQICRWANSRLNGNQRLYRVLAVDALPKNAGGKTQKSELRTIAAKEVALQ